LLIKNTEKKIPPDVDSTIADLIRRGWDHDPNARPDFKEILDKLWEIKDLKTGRFYCRIHEALSAEIFRTLFDWLQAKDVAALGVTSKHYYNLVKIVRHAKKVGKDSRDNLNSVKTRESESDIDVVNGSKKPTKAKSKKHKENLSNSHKKEL